MTSRLRSVAYLAVLATGVATDSPLASGSKAAPQQSGSPPLKEAAFAAEAMPASFRNRSRFLEADYAAAVASPPPGLVHMIREGEQTCAILGAGGGGELARISLPKSAGPESLIVADLGYEPTRNIRWLALESTSGMIRMALSLQEGEPVSIHKTSDGKTVRLMVSQQREVVGRFRSRGACGEHLFEHSGGGAPVTVLVEASALREGTSKTVFAARAQVPAGGVFKTLRKEAKSGDGASRSYSAAGYVSRDGKSVAFTFQAHAVRTDPEDGLQYHFTQESVPMEGSTSAGFFPLNSGGFVLPSAITPGAATPATIELHVSGGP